MKKVACVGILVADVMVSGMNGTPNKGELAERIQSKAVIHILN